MANTTREPSTGSDTTDLKALFADGINVQTADSNTIQTYVQHRFQQYADLNIEDWHLWNAIQIDFEGFKEKHFNKFDGPTWEILRGYCYKHGYWLDYKYASGKSRATIMVKTSNQTGTVHGPLTKSNGWKSTMVHCLDVLLCASKSL